MQTIRVDILNRKAVRLLKDLESLKLIKLHKEAKTSKPTSDFSKKYKGSLSKQNPKEVDEQLSQLRNEWE